MTLVAVCQCAAGNPFPDDVSQNPCGFDMRPAGRADICRNLRGLDLLRHVIPRHGGESRQNHAWASSTKGVQVPMQDARARRPCHASGFPLINYSNIKKPVPAGRRGRSLSAEKRWKGVGRPNGLTRNHLNNECQSPSNSAMPSSLIIINTPR